MKNPDDCIFCKIASGEIPTSTKVYEDKDTVAFLSTGPVSLGHTLLVPKKHSESIYDTDDAVLAALGIALKKVSAAVKKATGAQGINIMMNNDSVAGQAIFHAHFHIIPRFSNDGFKHWEEGKNYAASEAQKMADSIKLAFS